MVSFTIKKEEYINKTFRLKKELVERCSSEAGERDVSLNAFVTAALEYALANIDETNDSGEDKQRD